MIATAHLTGLGTDIAVSVTEPPPSIPRGESSPGTRTTSH